MPLSPVLIVPRIVALSIILVAGALNGSSNSEARTRGVKRDAVSEVIVHATGGPFCQGGRVLFSPAGTVERIQRFFESSGSVSIHYIIGPDGRIATSVPEDEVAIHAVGHNASSIGIELINAGDGKEPFPDAQIDALAGVVDGIRRRWRIPLAAIRGHDEVDTSTFPCGGREVRRKQDPGPLFPWDRLRAAVTIAGVD